MLKAGLALVLAAAVVLLTAAEAAGPRCVGAAARAAGCRESRPDPRVFPTPAQAMRMPNAPCRPVAFDVPFVCVFGASRDAARANVALIGDSHAMHWRAALGPVAARRGWHGSSLTRAGCPYSATRPILPARLLPDCLRWRAAIPGWLRAHREIHTVFVSEHRTRARGGIPAQVRGYLRAWRRLPRSVHRIVVIRDTPGSSAQTRACVNAAIAAHREAGAACAMPRRAALHVDPAAIAARRMHSRRVRLVDMTRFFCDARRCFPVIGGILVHKDDSHMTATYGATLAPYLAVRLARLGL